MDRSEGQACMIAVGLQATEQQQVDQVAISRGIHMTS